MTHCYTCELTVRRHAGQAPLWDDIHQAEYWDLAHVYNTALPGWLVLVLRRHVEALDELTEAEAVELGRLIRRVSAALKAVTGCLKTYVVQFAEAAEHPHVHVHVVPRMADLPDDRRGPKIFAYLGVPEAARVHEDMMNEMATKVRHILHQNDFSGKTG